MYIGEPWSWTPCAYEVQYGEQDSRSIREKNCVTGKIVYINRAHRYFIAEAEVYGYKLREGFKF